MVPFAGFLWRLHSSLYKVMISKTERNRRNSLRNARGRTFRGVFVGKRDPLTFGWVRFGNPLDVGDLGGHLLLFGLQLVL